MSCWASCTARLRALEDEEGRPIGILVDLQGPKIRAGHSSRRAVTLEGRRAREAVCAKHRPTMPASFPFRMPEIFAAIKQKHAS